MRRTAGGLRAEPVALPAAATATEDRRPYGKQRESWMSALVGGRMRGNVFRGGVPCIWMCRLVSDRLIRPVREQDGPLFAALRWLMGPYRDSAWA